MQNVSAQIIENMHVPLKDAAARSNGQARWELQAMTRNMRESELALKTWTPPTHTLETDEASDGDVVAALQHVCAMGTPTSSEGSSMASPKSVGRSGVNATFKTGTGLRYPVWKVILDFARSSHHPEVATTHKSERNVVILQVNSLVGTNSE